jgi:hypothetical protein
MTRDAPVRGAGTARFRYGWGWGEPKLEPDGLRGVGVADFDRRRTRVVGVPIPPRSVEEMRRTPISRPLDFVVLRLMGRKLARQKPHELYFEDGRCWVRRDDEWRELPDVEDPASDLVRPMKPSRAGEPMWHVVELTELGCDFDGPDLRAEWRAAAHAGTIQSRDRATD